MNGVLTQEDSNLLMNSINHYETIQHQEKLNLIISEQELLLMKTYSLVPFKDGGRWCVLLGEDIQTGIAGFGDTPIEAVLAFGRAFNQGK